MARRGGAQSRALSSRLVVRLILLPMALAAGIALSGCASTAETEPENLPAAERAGVMERLGSSLSSACGPTAGCYGLALRFAGFLWEYRDSFSVQTRVYRCVGQYALGAGYRWGVRRFVSEIDDEAKATSMVTYLYECAVPEWARAWFDGQDGEPPVPPGEIAPPPGQTRTRPATLAPSGPTVLTPTRTAPATSTTPTTTPDRVAPTSPLLPSGVRRSPAPSAPAATRPIRATGPAPIVGPPSPTRNATTEPSTVPPSTTAPIRPAPATTP